MLILSKNKNKLFQNRERNLLAFATFQVCQKLCKTQNKKNKVIVKTEKQLKTKPKYCYTDGDIQVQLNDLFPTQFP